MLTIGDLFSGIGGFSLGLERTGGFKTIWFSEIDPYASAVLKKHWPHVPNLGDVRSIRRETAQRVDVICGGFPCQPFSGASAGRALGKADDRYLWPEMLRVVHELEPAWVCGENVTDIDGMALETICADLEACGYEVQTFEIPACAVDADHIRQRAWILGHAHRDRQSRGAKHAEASGMSADFQSYPDRQPMEWPAISWGERSNGTDQSGIRRVADGIPNRMDRLRCLGNAIVPQIAEIIGRAIVSAEAA